MTRKETIIATILLIIFGTSMHFVHHVPFFNHFLGYIFPVKESVMAHMKMVIYPMLLLSLYLVISRRDIREFGAPILGGLAVLPCIVATFFSYWDHQLPSSCHLGKSLESEGSVASLAGVSASSLLTPP